VPLNQLPAATSPTETGRAPCLGYTAGFDRRRAEGGRVAHMVTVLWHRARSPRARRRGVRHRAERKHGQKLTPPRLLMHGAHNLLTAAGVSSGAMAQVAAPALFTLGQCQHRVKDQQPWATTPCRASGAYTSRRLTPTSLRLICRPAGSGVRETRLNTRVRSSR